MTVYFISAGQDGPIKIGFTAGDLGKRIAGLQIGCPFQLKLIGSVAGTMAHEKLLHDELKQQKLAGEWFDRTESLLKRIQNVLATGFNVIERLNEPPFRALVAEAVKVVGSQVALAEKMGRSQQQVSALCTRAISISAEDALAIHRATDGEIPASKLRPDLWASPDSVPAPEPANTNSEQAAAS